MISEIVERQSEIIALCRRYGVRRLEVFGSAATGHFDPLRSDIDFLVEYPSDYDYGLWLEKYFVLKDDLRWLLGRPVDLVMSDAPNKPAFWASANQSREVIYDAAEIAPVVDGHGRTGRTP